MGLACVPVLQATLWIPQLHRDICRRAMKRRRILKALFNSCGGVTTVGDDAFVRATIAALELLKNRTPDVYALLQKHVGCVVSSKPTRVSGHFLAACCLTSLLAYAPT